MKLFKKIGLVLIGSLSLMACGGNRSMNSTDTGKIPKWYAKTPKDTDNMYGTYTAVSQDMQLSADKATVGANLEIAKQVSVNIDGMFKKFDEETGTAEKAELLQNFNQATRQVVSQTLVGLQVAEKYTVKDGDLWRTYVLVAYPIGESNKAILEKLKQIQSKRIHLEETKTFQELDSAVTRYNDRQVSGQN